MNDTLKKEAEALRIPYEKMGRVLVWHDEFAGDGIDPEKWCFYRTMSAADREYDNSERCIRLEDGQLHMQVHRSQQPGANFALSEGFTTKDTMNFKYGYLELRARVPFRHGAWPSFWMKSDTPFAKSSYMAEIDIYEVFSSQKDVVANLHKWGSGKHVMLPGGEGSLNRAYTFKNWENLNNEYHVYGFEWTPKETKYYVDGECYAVFPIDESGEFGDEPVLAGMSGFHDFAYPIFNNEIFSEGSSWKPEGCLLTDADPMPIDYYLDYLRLYQNPATEELKLGEEIRAAKE